MLRTSVSITESKGEKKTRKHDKEGKPISEIKPKKFDQRLSNAEEQDKVIDFYVYLATEITLFPCSLRVVALGEPISGISVKEKGKQLR